MKALKSRLSLRATPHPRDAVKKPILKTKPNLQAISKSSKPGEKPTSMPKPTEKPKPSLHPRKLSRSFKIMMYYLLMTAF